MENVVNETLKKILRIARALSIVKTLLYLIGGILILIWNENIAQYIYIIVGVDLLALASLELIKEIVGKGYKKSSNHIGTATFTLLVGILILTRFHDDFYIVSVMWAVATVVNSTMEINEGIHEIHERKTFSILNFAFAIAEIVFSILLLIEPEENSEHFLTHIYLLGVGFLLEAAEELIRVFSPYLLKVPLINQIPVFKNLAEEREEELEITEEQKKVIEEIQELKIIEKINEKKEDKWVLIF